MSKRKAVILPTEYQHPAPVYREKALSFDGRTDAEIWENFMTGDDDAFVYIYNNYVNKLLRFGRQFASNELVKDAIQDLFLYLKKRKKKGKEISRIAPYLYKSLYRMIIAKLEYEKKFKAHEHPESKNWEINISRETKLISMENQEELSNQLQESLNKLSVKQRQAILLYYYEGLTHDEISDIMDLSNKSSVRKLIQRGLDSLQRIFSIRQ